MPSVISNVENGMDLFRRTHRDTDHILVISTLTILLPRTSNVAKCATSKFHTILPASGRSTYRPASKPGTTTSIYQSSPSRTSCPSSIYPRMARSVKLNTRSTTPPVWDVHTARLLSKSGRTLILLPCLRERWVPAHGTLHWMTVGAVGIGKRCSEWVSTTPVLSGNSVLTIGRFPA
jgi:hypothetical protein